MSSPVRELTVTHLEKAIDHLQEAIRIEAKECNFDAVQYLGSAAGALLQFTRNGRDDFDTGSPIQPPRTSAAVA